MARFQSGWIKLHRSIAESDIGRDGHCLAIMTTLLLWANRFSSTVDWKGVPREIPAGSVVLGLRELAFRLGFSKDTVHRKLKYLAARDTIVLETATKGTLVTIRNWGKYQDQTESLRHDEGHNCDGSRTLAGREPTLNGEDKNRRSITVQSDFDLEAIYRRYPRKEGKTPGLRKLAKVIKTPEQYGNLQRAVDNYARAKQGSERQFLKLFSTFAGEWQDWIQPDTQTALNSGSINTTLLRPEDIQ